MFIDYCDKCGEAIEALEDACKSNREFNEVVEQFEVCIQLHTVGKVATCMAG